MTLLSNNTLETIYLSQSQLTAHTLKIWRPPFWETINSHEICSVPAASHITTQ